MGQLHYGSPAVVLEMDDVTLAHLEAVAIAKLRRNEPFAISVDDPTGGRRTVWINTASTLMFQLHAPVAEIDRARIDRFLDGANSNAGIRLPLD